MWIALIETHDNPVHTKHTWKCTATTRKSKSSKYELTSSVNGHRTKASKRQMHRITLPPEATQRISELMSPGSSLIVSDNALSDETDADTDFIVLTP